MRAIEDALDPLVLRNIMVDPRCGIGVVTEHRDDGVALVKNDHSTVQVWNGNVVALNGCRGWHA